jgi:RsiW-degrading membrane proteinase PrsW (M82 family)
MMDPGALLPIYSFPMPSLLLALGAAALPAALILAYFFWLDRKRPEPVGLLGRSVLYGFIAVIPAAAIEIAAARFIPTPPGALGILFEAFAIAALVEESTKLFFVKRYIFKRKEFDERADGIVYSICVSLGFAFVENFLYGYRDFDILLVRAFTAVPGHAVFSGVMGYYLGIAKLEKGRSGAWAKGLGWAILLHGLYDAFILSGGLASLLIIPLLCLGWAALVRLFRAARAADAAEAKASYQSPEPPIL